MAETYGVAYYVALVVDTPVHGLFEAGADLLDGPHHTRREAMARKDGVLQDLQAYAPRTYLSVIGDVHVALRVIRLHKTKFRETQQRLAAEARAAGKRPPYCTTYKWPPPTAWGSKRFSPNRPIEEKERFA